MTLRKDRRGVLWILGALFAVQVYFVQELLAMALLAGIIYVAFAAFVGGFLFLHRAGTRVMGWLEPYAAPLTAGAQRQWQLALEFSRKRLHRPRSLTAP